MAIGQAVCVFTSFVMATEIAVSITFAGLGVGVDLKPEQEVNVNRNTEITDPAMILMFPLPFFEAKTFAYCQPYRQNCRMSLLLLQLTNTRICSHK